MNTSRPTLTVSAGRSDIFFAAGAVGGLIFALSGLYGFTADLIAGATTTDTVAVAPVVVERATDAGRYWGLMSAWLSRLVGGGFAFVFCGGAWRARRSLRAE
jgi:hypothetical protein